MTPNTDGTLTVLGAQLTTRQVEELMHQLAQARNLMQPPVQMEVTADMPVLVQHDADFAISQTQTPERHVSLGLRHLGFGWIFFTLSRERAKFIGESLLQRSRS
ncbi:hypothetical protein [Polaromonas sp. SM01]|uniref:hypothetical protein n=1 Tax=Polaromonas sp. SM01 TaxID=3085630 RepID=UPI002980D2CF|nr:hypothetical protein [Polaromonas sp. SM01]MDW5443190.1 hypothetical protein [Polaromonas sp. SM01]